MRDSYARRPLDLALYLLQGDLESVRKAVLVKAGHKVGLGELSSFELEGLKKALLSYLLVLCAYIVLKAEDFVRALWIEFEGVNDC